MVTCQEFPFLDSINGLLCVTSEQAKVEKLRNQVEMQDRKIAAQDLTIDALKTMMNETYALAEKNLEAINPGTSQNMIIFKLMQKQQMVFILKKKTTTCQ